MGLAKEQASVTTADIAFKPTDANGLPHSDDGFVSERSRGRRQKSHGISLRPWRPLSKSLMVRVRSQRLDTLFFALRISGLCHCSDNTLNRAASNFIAPQPAR